MRRACFEKSGGISKTVFQPQIDHIIILKLAQAGIFGAVEKHIARGDLPVVTNFVFCEYFTGRSVIPACAGEPYADRAVKIRTTKSTCFQKMTKGISRN